MSLRKPQCPQIEVDMVPLIDIISLLLMFLVIVGGIIDIGDTDNVKLPRADQGRIESSVRTEGRIVVSLKEEKGVFLARINNKSYELLSDHQVNQTLQKHLDKETKELLARGLCKQDSNGSYDIPVKLRIPELAPMQSVEAVLESLSRIGLRDIQYAVLPENSTGAQN